MPETYFPASYDRTTRIISAVFALIVLGIVVVTQSALVGGIVVLSVLLSYGLSPRGYLVLINLLL